MQRQHLVIFFVCFSSLLWSTDQFIYFMLLVGFKNIRKCLIKTYRSERCDSNKCFVLLWTCLYKKANYLSVNNPFVPLLKLLMSTENKLRRKHGHNEKVGSLSKMQKKMDKFFLKEFWKNISLNSKEIISPQPFPFKGFPTNTINVPKPRLSFTF